VKNVEYFRGFIKTLIKERREELTDNSCQNKDNFLSILLQDDLYKDNEEMIVDECITITVAAT